MPNMGGGGQGGGNMQNLFMQLMMQNPDLFNDPEIMGLMNDPAFSQKLQQYQNSGNVMAMFQDPQIQKIMQKIQSKSGNKQPDNKDNDMNDTNENKEPSN